MDNGLTWSLTTFNVSPLKFGMNNNSSTASMEDSPSDKSRSSTATSASVRCCASNGHAFSVMEWTENDTPKVHKHCDRQTNLH